MLSTILLTTAVGCWAGGIRQARLFEKGTIELSKKIATTQYRDGTTTFIQLEESPFSNKKLSSFYSKTVATWMRNRQVPFYITHDTVFPSSNYMLNHSISSFKGNSLRFRKYMYNNDPSININTLKIQNNNLKLSEGLFIYRFYYNSHGTGTAYSDCYKHLAKKTCTLPTGNLLAFCSIMSSVGYLFNEMK